MRHARAGHSRLNLPLAPLPKKALLHGHCHQKAFDAMSAVETTLRLIPQLSVETIESSCCGMAGSFGYHAETIEASQKMGELSLLPTVRKAPADALIVSDGTSCRHQILDGSEREAAHVARVLADPEDELSLTAGLFCPDADASACDVSSATAHVLPSGAARLDPAPLPAAGRNGGPARRPTPAAPRSRPPCRRGARCSRAGSYSRSSAGILTLH